MNTQDWTAKINAEAPRYCTHVKITTPEGKHGTVELNMAAATFDGMDGKLEYAHMSKGGKLEWLDPKAAPATNVVKLPPTPEQAKQNIADANAKRDAKLAARAAVMAAKEAAKADAAKAKAAKMADRLAKLPSRETRKAAAKRAKAPPTPAPAPVTPPEPSGTVATPPAVEATPAKAKAARPPSPFTPKVPKAFVPKPGTYSGDMDIFLWNALLAGTPDAAIVESAIKEFTGKVYTWRGRPTTPVKISAEYATMWLGMARVEIVKAGLM